MKEIKIIICGLFCLSGCMDDTYSDVEPNASPYLSQNEELTYNLPFLRGIELFSLGQSTSDLNVVDTTSCPQSTGGFAFHQKVMNEVCVSVPSISPFFYGVESFDRDEDGIISCDDFLINNEEPALLPQILCGEKAMGGVMNGDAETLLWKEQTLQTSFRDLDKTDNFDAQGIWVPGSAIVFPAQISLWLQKTPSTLAPISNLKMATHHLESLAFDLNPLGVPLKGFQTLDFRAEGSNCPTSVGVDDCKLQELYWENGISKKIDTAHLRILSDRNVSPAFLLLEGKLYYSSDTPLIIGEAVFKLRSIYLKAIQLGDYLWVQMVLKDSYNNELTIHPSRDESNYFRQLKQGFCHDLNETQINFECMNFPVVPKQYAHLMKGESYFLKPNSKKTDLMELKMPTH